MLLLGFGWARPVPVNVSGFRIKNRKADSRALRVRCPTWSWPSSATLWPCSWPYKVQSDAMFIQTVQMFFSYIGALSVGLGVF